MGSVLYSIDPYELPMGCLKKNQNAPGPSEHPPVRGENMSKHLGGIKGCKYKTSSWHLNGFPDDSNIGSTVQCRGEVHRYTVHLHLSPCRDTRKTAKTKRKQCSTPSNMVVIIYCYIGCKYKATTWYLNGFPDGSNLGSTV